MLESKLEENKKRTLTIEAGRADRRYWADIFEYKELFYFLTWRNFMVRYKQTVIGVAWSVIRPVITMIVFTLIFGRVANLPSENAPYAVLVFSALLPWQFFANALQGSSTSVIGNPSMVSKIYFPKIIIPTSFIIVCLVDFFISLVILGILMLWYRFMPTWQIFYMPLFLMLDILLVLGVGFLTSALNVKYRDFKYIVPFVIQAGLFASPVGFSSDIVPDKFRMIYSLNPMVGIIDGFRWSIIGGEINFYIPGFIISIVLVFVLLFLGTWYFRKSENTFADKI